MPEKRGRKKITLFTRATSGLTHRLRTNNRAQHTTAARQAINVLLLAI